MTVVVVHVLEGTALYQVNAGDVWHVPHSAKIGQKKRKSKIALEKVLRKYKCS